MARYTISFRKGLRIRTNPDVRKVADQITQLTHQEFSDLLWELSDNFRLQGQNNFNPSATKIAVHLSRLATEMIETSAYQPTYDNGPGTRIHK